MRKTARKKRVGRPAVEVKKVPFQVMLDPRYIEHFREMAKEKKVMSQDLARMALNAFVPDPYNPLAQSLHFTKPLVKKSRK